jgi:hypothetical protein
MPSGADLFVVCKHCEAEVSPYVTECPYCGQRLRRRAPKIPRESVGRTRSAGVLSRLAGRSGPSRGERVHSETRERRAPAWLASGTRPYVTIAAVAASCAVYVAEHGELLDYDRVQVEGPLHGDWWRLITTQFSYENGWYAFVALFAIALFGWLIESRHGAVLTLALLLGAGVTGALAAEASESFAWVAGGNAAALALIAAWAVPDLLRARSGGYYEGDLLGAGALAAILLATPFARPEASWIAGITGGALGALVGFGLYRFGGET